MFNRGNITRPARMGWLRSAAAGGLLVVAGAACGGSASHSSTAAPSAAAPAGDQTVAPRVDPSSDQVASAIAAVKSRVSISFLPTEQYVRAFGDAACTAFDQGKTKPQVQALVLQAASQIPSGSISAADADFAVRTAVNLFCPGYADRLAS